MALRSGSGLIIDGYDTEIAQTAPRVGSNKTVCGLPASGDICGKDATQYDDR